MEKLNLTGIDLPEKELKILESAIKVFSEKGFSAATTSEIAKNAGIAEGTIFRYFKTKKDILRGILIQTINLFSTKLVMENVEKILLNPENKDLKMILKELLYDRMRLVDSVFPMARVVLTEALFHEDVREAIYQNVISKALVTIKAFLKRMVDNGMIRSDIEPEVFLRGVIGHMVLLIGSKKLFSDKFKLEDIDKEFDKMIDFILYGIAPKRNPAGQ